LATRQRLHSRVRLGVETDELEDLVDRAGPGVVPGVSGEGLANREERLDGQLLQDHAQALAQLAAGGAVGGVVAEHVDPAAVAGAESLEDLDGRRLAGSVGPEQGEDLTLLHYEGHVLDSVDLAVALAQMLHRNSRHAVPPGAMCQIGFEPMRTPAAGTSPSGERLRTNVTVDLASHCSSVVRMPSQ